MPRCWGAKAAAWQSWENILVRERSTYKGPADKSRRRQRMRMREDRMRGDPGSGSPKGRSGLEFEF